MTLSKDELAELTHLINARRDELAHGLSRLSAGEVRMAHDVFIEWLEGQPATAPNTDRVDHIDTYALTDAYQFGYARGREAMQRELGVDNVGDSSPRLVTNSAPEPDEDASAGPDHPDAKWRDLMRDMDEAMAEPPPISDEATATLGPENVVVTPLKTPNSAGRFLTLPSPDQARENVAAALAAANGGNGDHAFDFTPRHKAGRHNAPKGKGQEPSGRVLPSREQVVAFLREIAMGKTMPTMEQFNTARPGNWATVQAHILRLGVSWDELRLEAGLAPNPRNRNTQADAL